MTLRRVLPALAALPFFASGIAAQNRVPPPPTWIDEVKGFVGYHQLMPIEFPVNDRVHPEAAFWMAPMLHPTFEFNYHGGSLVYAYISNWHISAGLNKNEMSRKSQVRNMRVLLPFAQAVFDLYEIRARELSMLMPGDLPRGSGPTTEAARERDLEGRLRVFLEDKHEKLQIDVDEFVKGTGRGANPAKVRELATAIRKRLEALPRPTPVPSPLPLATATVTPAP